MNFYSRAQKILNLSLLKSDMVRSASGPAIVIASKRSQWALTYTYVYYFIHYFTFTYL